MVEGIDAWLLFDAYRIKKEPGRTVDGHYAVAIKKRSLGGESYLATVHGYPTNLSVCEQLIAPYNQVALCFAGRVLLRRATLIYAPMLGADASISLAE